MQLTLFCFIRTIWWMQHLWRIRKIEQSPSFRLALAQNGVSNLVILVLIWVRLDLRETVLDSSIITQDLSNSQSTGFVD